MAADWTMGSGCSWTILQQVKQIWRVVFMEREVSCSSGPRVVMRELRHLARHWWSSMREGGVVTRRWSIRVRVFSTWLRNMGPPLSAIRTRA